MKRGAALLRLESPELSAKALAARAEVATLSGERNRATSELAEARLEEAHRLRVAEADKRLLAEGAIAKSAAEASALAAASAAERVRTIEARLLSLSGSREGSQSTDGPRSRLSLARESADALERRVAALNVRAPMDGVVYGLPRRSGEAVAAGQVIASVSDPNHRRLRARIDQPDLPRVAPGQRLVVTFDGLPERRWEGTVAHVSPGLREAGGREVGEVVGEIADSSSALPPNAAVNVQIVAGERRRVLVLARAALFRDGTRRYVFVNQGGKAMRRDVEIGLIGLSEVEVTGGLREGEAAILPGAVPLTDGRRVVAQKAS